MQAATITNGKSNNVVTLAVAYYNSLTSAQQGSTLVGNTAANVAHWSNRPPTQAAAYLTLYQNELASTYVGISRASTSSTTAPDLTTQGDYVRIDGPHVWCEIATQNGVVISNKAHYHTVWRDRVTDYGAAYGF